MSFMLQAGLIVAETFQSSPGAFNVDDGCINSFTLQISNHVLTKVSARIIYFKIKRKRILEFCHLKF